MSVCEITIVGNVGRDPEMRYTAQGTAVTQFSVAVNQSRPDPQSQTGWTDETDWFRVSVWGKQAERAAEELVKGAKVLVIGHFKSREWRSDKTGQTGTALEIRGDKVVKLDRSPRGEEGTFRAPPATEREPAEPRGDDSDLELPF